MPWGRFAGIAYRVRCRRLLSAEHEEFADGRNLLVAEVLTWVMQRRIVLADRVEELRKELAETEAEVARLEAAEVVIGQFIEAERADEADDPVMDAELGGSRRRPGRAACC